MTLLNELNGRTESEKSQQNEVIQPQVQEKNVRQTTFILIGAIAVVFAGVWLMHKKNVSPEVTAGVNDQDLQIETAIAKLTGINKENINQVDAIVKRFYEFADFGQVKPEQLNTDPFSLNWAGAGMSISSMKKETAGSFVAPKMELLSIMKSKNGNCCMIDDMLLYKGDKINGFEVVEIGDDFVRLQSDGHDITLYLQTGNDK